MQAVHSGADLQASAKEASGSLPQAVKEHLGYVLTHAQDHIMLPLMENAVEARTELQQHCIGNRCTRFSRVFSWRHFGPLPDIRRGTDPCKP